MINIRDVIAQAVTLDDGTITHCGRPVEWESHWNADYPECTQEVSSICYAWVCTKCLVMSNYDCQDTPCPEGDGGLDCTPFCPTCEGKQFVTREDN